eukprot:scaffold92322_cov22-Cyclotella_meneghiniana.AAC.1
MSGNESLYTYEHSPVHPVNLNKLVVIDSDKENEVVVAAAVKEDPIVAQVASCTTSQVNQEDHNNAQHDVIPRGMSNETMSATDGTVSTMDFEDALEDHSVNNHHDSIRHYDDQEGGEMMQQQQQQGRDGSSDNYYNQGPPNNEENASIAAYHDGQQYYQHNEQGGNNEYYHNHQQENQHYHPQQSEQANYYHQDVNTASSSQQQQYYSTLATPTHGNKSVPSNATTPKAGTTTATTTSTSATTNHHTTLESSNAEDVLTLSLELERVRTQLATTTQHLSTSQSHISTLQSHNAHLQSELHRLHSELEEEREHNSNAVSSLQSKLQDEITRANAAEEDAAIALELAKDATNAKEECEEYLNRSVEEIDAWKGRCEGLERELLNCQQQQMLNENQVEEEEDVKKVRFADESESGGIPPPPPTTPSAKPWTSTPVTTPQITPNKSSIASGRAYLYRHSPKKSPYKEQVQDLLKRTAETRRLLKEQIMSSPSSKQLPSSLALVTTSTTTMNTTNAPSSLLPREGSKLSLNEDGFASRQGAACRSVGKMIRDSGCRLKLNGKWFDNNTTASSSNTTNGNNNDNNEGQHQQSSLVIEGVAELECMVKEYCSTVEGTIGNQDKRIEELLAFCDHLEKELVN